MSKFSFSLFLKFITPFIIASILLAPATFPVNAAPSTAMYATRYTSSFQMTTLDHNKTLVNKKNTSFNSAYQSLLSLANNALSQGPYSVTFKTQLAPSGNQHDYMSLNKYCWPNPATPNGLPYIYKDGQVNPEVALIPDKVQMMSLFKNVNILSMAYYLSGNEAYAKKAIALIRAWFIDPATRMNPNMEYAQFVPGDIVGSWGIIELADITFVIDSFLLIQTSPSVTSNDYNQLKTWFSDYLNWLTTSEKGRGESQTTNNHRNWYASQVAGIAIFVGKTDVAKNIINDTKSVIASQIQPDGKQPEELARTNSWEYSNYNMEAFLRLAIIGNNLGINLATYTAPNGASIRKALDYLTPYAQTPSKWTYQNLDAWDNNTTTLDLYNATRLYANTRYQTTADGLKYKNLESWTIIKNKYF